MVIPAIQEEDNRGEQSDASTGTYVHLKNSTYYIMCGSISMICQAQITFKLSVSFKIIFKGATINFENAGYLLLTGSSINLS